MGKKLKDVDFLVISARVREMETHLLSQKKMEQIFLAPTDEEAQRLLVEWGYPKLDPARPNEMDAQIFALREATFLDLSMSVPERRYIDIFRLKYDYHNAKVLLKAQDLKVEADSLLVHSGCVPVEDLKKALLNRRLESLPAFLADGISQAQDILERTRDPQLCEMALDYWCEKAMCQMARETGSEFLQRYLQVQIDADNLRTLIRTARMGKNADFLKEALFDGGEVSAEEILRVSAAKCMGVAQLYGNTRFAEAAAAGAEALQTGEMTEFERVLDDGVCEFLSGAKAVSFGEAPLISYLAARESEYKNVRILLLGRSAGLSLDLIRSRLRTGLL